MENLTPAYCGSNACADGNDNGDGTFTLTSTLGPDSGAVMYTAEEVVEFFDGIKAGRWDKMYDRAKQYVTNQAAQRTYA